MKSIISKTALLLVALVSTNAALADDTRLPDSDITSSVQSNINSDSALANTGIKVTTRNGVVTLSGKVDTDAQATEAATVAQSTAGVVNVNTGNLQVAGSSSRPFADALITAKVKGMFAQQKLFGDKDIAAMTIRVETNAGVVTLSGTADNQDQIDNAVKIAKSISGVKDVQNNVKINDTTANASS